MNDSQKIAMIREVMPAVKNKVYLNTGSVGPSSQIWLDALQAAETQGLEDGRGSYLNFRRSMDITTELRAAMARLVNTEPENIALTHHTTEGMNIVSHGLTWQPGDEVITTTSEHEGGLMPLYVLRQRQGIVVKTIDVWPGDDIVAKFEAAITPRTRALVFSHVNWNTGMRMPLQALATLARERHMFSIVDAAQSTGAIPLDLPASGVDFYAMPCQKWLGGPTGIGALYVRPDRRTFVSPTFAGFRTLEDVSMYDFTGHFVPAKSAKRYEVGTTNNPAFAGMVAHLNWLENEVGWDWLYTRIAHLAAYAHDGLSQLPNTTVITPSGKQSGLITFSMDGYEPSRAMTKLLERDILLRFIRLPSSLRISTGYYNTEADIDTLIEGLKFIQTLDPESLPEFSF
ncbi:MAG: aminotransferase class V-fold PLP-dependent enzyme [Chloroflexota bacterium]